MNKLHKVFVAGTVESKREHVIALLDLFEEYFLYNIGDLLFLVGPVLLAIILNSLGHDSVRETKRSHCIDS